LGKGNHARKKQTNKEVEGKSKIITKELAVKNDYNLSPTRYIQNGDSDELKPVNEIVAELKDLESEQEKIDKELKNILGKIKL